MEKINSLAQENLNLSQLTATSAAQRLNTSRIPDTLPGYISGLTFSSQHNSQVFHTVSKKVKVL